MKRVKEWFASTDMVLFLFISYSAALVLMLFGIVDLSRQNIELKKEMVSLKNEVEEKQNLIIERNNELYLCKMEKDEWKELFYSEIDFHPYEGPDW